MERAPSLSFLYNLAFLKQLWEEVKYFTKTG
jgi:hypothetical protein